MKNIRNIIKTDKILFYLLYMLFKIPNDHFPPKFTIYKFTILKFLFFSAWCYLGHLPADNENNEGKNFWL